MKIKSRLISLICLLILSNCGSDDAQDPSSNTDSPSGEITENVMMPDGESRTYTYYKPSTSSSDKLPVMVMLHGNGSNAREMISYSGANILAESEDFIIVYPESTETGEQGLFGALRSWPVSPFEIGYSDRLAIEQEYLNRVLDVIIRDNNVDENRIYMTGYSGGAYMTYASLCNMQDRIAAFGGYGGLLYPSYLEGCSLRPLPIIHIHGTADENVRYEGRSDSEYGVEEWIDIHRESVNCQNNEEFLMIDPNLNDGTTVDRFVYSDCDGGVEVELFRINGGGHQWPGATFDIPGLFPGDGVRTLDIDGTEEFWNFFSKFSLPDAG